MLQPARESQLSFERGGRIVSLAVDEGDSVEHGQMLGQLDVSQVESELASLQAQLVQARARLAELTTGPRQEVIAAARADVASREASCERLRRNYERRTQLVSTKAVSKEELDDARFTMAVAVAERDAAGRRLDELLAGTRVEQLDAQSAVVDQLVAEAAKTAHDLEDGRLIAPFRGRVAERFLDEGAVVTAGAPVLHILEDQRLEAWIGVPPDAAQELRIGDALPVEVGDDTYQAEVASLRPSLDPVTRTQNVVLRMPSGESPRLVAGQIARLELTQQIAVRGVRLPTTGLTPGSRGLWSVYVAAPGDGGHVIEKRDVELLYTLDDESLVRGTLEDGELVVTTGTHRVVAGQHVTPATSLNVAAAEELTATTRERVRK
jgi:RND family efflux transporter MFP subunit